MLNFKNEYYLLEKGRVLYPTAFTDLVNIEIYGSKEGGITGTEDTAHVFKIPSNYYTLNTGNIDFSKYPDGIENDFKSIKIVNIENLISLPVNFNEWKDITPDNLKVTFEKLGLSVKDVQKRLSEVGLYIDSNLPGEIGLPKLPVGCTWYCNQDGHITAIPINDLYGKFNQMIEHLKKILEEYATERGLLSKGIIHEIHQPNHGFIFEPITYDNGVWRKADISTSADGMGVIKDNDKFYFVEAGEIEIPEEALDKDGQEIVEDEYYYLNENGVGLQREEPLYYYQPILHTRRVKNKLVADVNIETMEDLRSQVVDTDTIHEHGLATLNDIPQTFDTIARLQKSFWLREGQVVEVLGYYEAGDGAGHKRIIASEDDGSGVQLNNGLWANIVHNGEVNVSWFGAKGDGVTDDTEFFKKMFKSSNIIANLSNNKHYVITKPIELTENFMGIINCNNSTIISKVIGDYTFKLINNGWGRKIVIKNMRLQGGYKAKGIFIQGSDCWVLENLWIRECVVGISLDRTYYGEFLGMCRIDKCLTGILFEPTGEINTIGIKNISINIGKEDSKKYNPKLESETENDYQLRCPSYGIKINSNVQGICFLNCTIEGHTYGIYGRTEIPTTEGYFPFIQIKNCYFEKNYFYHIFLDSFERNTGKCLTYWDAQITGNRMFGGVNEVKFSSGSNIIFKENQKCNIKLKYITNSALNLITDVQENDIDKSDFDISKQIFLLVNTNNTRNIRKEEKFILPNEEYDQFAKDLVYLKSAEESDSQLLPTNIKNQLGYGYRIKSITSKFITFIDKGTVVNKDISDNNFYMNVLYKGKTIIDKISNRQYLFKNFKCEPAKYFIDNIQHVKEDTIYILFESGKDIKKVSNRMVLAYDNTIPAYGTALDYSKITPQNPRTYYSPIVYNSEIGITYYWYLDHWALCSTTCLKTHARSSKRAIGTTSQRPVLDDNEKYYFIYYNTELNQYEMFKENNWVIWDKILKFDFDINPDTTSQIQQLNTSYYSRKMEKEGVLQEFDTYMDEKTAYDKQQEKLEKQRQLAYKQALEENPELTYEEFMSAQPMTLNLIEEPQPSEALKKFMDKYL